MNRRMPVLAGLFAACQVLLSSLPASAAEGTDKSIAITYPVADLVVPISDATAAVLGVDKPEKAGRSPATMEKQLIDVIVSNIRPRSWTGSGGHGAIRYFPGGMALVIDQTQAAHEQIADLL